MVLCVFLRPSHAEFQGLGLRLTRAASGGGDARGAAWLGVAPGTWSPPPSPGGVRLFPRVLRGCPYLPGQKRCSGTLSSELSCLRERPTLISDALASDKNALLLLLSPPPGHHPALAASAGAPSVLPPGRPPAHSARCRVELWGQDSPASTPSPRSPMQPRVLSRKWEANKLFMCLKWFLSPTAPKKTHRNNSKPVSYGTTSPPAGTPPCPSSSLPGMPAAPPPQPHRSPFLGPPESQARGTPSGAP